MHANRHGRICLHPRSPSDKVNFYKFTIIVWQWLCRRRCLIKTLIIVLNWIEQKTVASRDTYILTKQLTIWGKSNHRDVFRCSDTFNTIYISRRLILSIICTVWHTWHIFSEGKVETVVWTRQVTWIIIISWVWNAEVLNNFVSHYLVFCKGLRTDV